ncbi:putative quinol monooxygenase [Rubrimonas sp.]|uniref:putative quinol monooxygenase n=1 Tax=Rubrimonas sp. TaxID=2036015 RepID=UPI002FDC9ADD
MADPTVRIEGRLICRDRAQADRIAEFLVEHVRLTRAESACLSFEVTRDPADALVFVVSETFVDAAGFAAHKARMVGTVWAEISEGATRDYVVTGLAPADG